jgi:tyrosyl-tRNA synthetase
MPPYDFEKLKDALLFNTVETIPQDGNDFNEEIKVLIENSQKSGQPIKHYIGFEISGKIHIGTGIASGLKLKKLQDAGVKCIVYLANYHTWLNGKLDGNLETINKVSKNYFEPVLKESFRAVGCNVEAIDFIRANEIYNQVLDGKNFWLIDLQVSRELTLSRVLKSISITGKEAGNDVNFGTLRYAPMQVADCFFFGTHIVHAGIDQRKCHVLMREVAPKLNSELTLKIGDTKIKPIAIHHDLLLGLSKPNDGAVAKMSKSKPDSAIWVHDNASEIDRKLKKAYCPLPNMEKQSLNEIKVEQSQNPLLNWCKNLIFPAGKAIEIKRKPEWGGDIKYSVYTELESDYFTGNLHPADLKNGISNCLVNWFSPIQDYTQKNSKGLELLESIKN